MRKTLSIVLSVMLILSACCFAIPVSAAPEGTAINTADEFMAMAADGTYYLNADITLTGTYATPFTGTFDGNGKTVTISAPMFAEFNGTVKNLTMNGSISSAENAAAFALLSNEGMIAENVTSNVSITIMGEGRYGASIICENYGTNMVSEYTNCVNNGDIYIDTTAAEKSRVGGIGAIVENAVFTKCVNNGDITTIGNIGMAAGICARAALHAGVNTAEAYYCVNNGDITATDNYATTGGSDAAGIFAYIGCASNMGFYTVYGCLNTGDISAPYRAAGMVSYTYGSGATAFIDIEFCVSTGNITYGRTATSAASAADYGSYFVGYTNSPSTVIKYNIGTGTIKKVDGSISTNPTCLIGCSSADPTLYDVTDNYIIDNGAYTNFSYSGKEGYESFIMDMSYGIENGAIIRTTEADLASGKVTVAINNAAQGGYTGEYFFYQTIGTDAIPTVDSSSGWVLENNGTYVNGEKPVAPVVTTTEKQEDPTTTPVEEDPTTTPVEEDPTTTPAEVEPTTTPADNT
ncbi:MAG: hypothetical protein IJY27_03030, partial [Clostridia bacterium]|nr:hypothetical protein [Clostridia bacterium]